MSFIPVSKDRQALAFLASRAKEKEFSTNFASSLPVLNVRYERSVFVVSFHFPFAILDSHLRRTPYDFRTLTKTNRKFLK